MPLKDALRPTHGELMNPNRPAGQAGLPASPFRARLLSSSVLLLASVAVLALIVPTALAEETPDSRCSAPEQITTAPGGDPPDLLTPCSEGVVDDDATVESGYGWVPSAIWGVYVQAYDRTDIRPAGVDSVCVCWLRTRDDDSIDFEVVFYRELADGIPELEPYAAFPARATGVPMGVVGQFTRVDTRGVAIPPDGPVYIGVRWDPSLDQFFFVCNDRTPETPYTEAFFIDDRAEGWGIASDTNDPIFTPHRAMMVRPVPRQPVAIEVPALGSVGKGLLALLLALAGIGVTALGRR